MSPKNDNQKHTASVYVRIWRFTSAGFVFMAVMAAIILFGFRALTGINLVQCGALTGATPVDCWPVDFSNVAEVRVFLWKFSALITVGIALASYVINDLKVSAIIGAGCCAYWATSIPYCLEVLVAIVTCCSCGILFGWGLNRVTVSSSSKPWKRVFGRTFAILAAATIVFIPFLANSVFPWFVIPIYYLKTALYSSGAFVSLYQKAKTESLAIG